MDDNNNFNEHREPSEAMKKYYEELHNNRDNREMTKTDYIAIVVFVLISLVMFGFGFYNMRDMFKIPTIRDDQKVTVSTTTNEATTTTTTTAIIMVE